MEYVLFALFLLYLLPWILAEARGHERATVVLLVNLAVGWTGVGWIAALWWARSAEPPSKTAEPERGLRLVRGGGEGDGRRGRAPVLRVAEVRAVPDMRAAAQSGSEKATSASPRRVPARACPPAATTT
ncbi:MAG: superinfection immunity protein [Myxococcota bacterium]|nr:superinfection immunity protein [Myxococcota bacterium]